MLSQEIQSIRSRPRFRKYIKAPEQEVLKAFINKEALQGNVLTRVATHHVFMKMEESQQHFWSPQLGLAVEPLENGGSLIRGLYGPRPQIWTMFVFLYAAISMGTLAMLIWGLSQHLVLHTYPWALWFVPGGLLTVGGIYLLTQFGQKLSFPQMEEIHNQFHSTLSGFEVMEPPEN